MIFVFFTSSDFFYFLYTMSLKCFTVFCRDAGFVERTLGHGDLEALEVLEGVWNSLEDIKAGGQRPTSWEDCVIWAHRKWETLFNNDIRQLLHCCPSDKVYMRKSNPVPYCCNLSLWTHRGSVVNVRSLHTNQLNTVMRH